MSNSANKIVNPFAVDASEIDGYPSETPDTEGFYNSGGWSSGFMTKPPGYKPRGQTFNRLFFELFYRAKDYCVNKIYRYDSTHSANLGGYPLDATVLGNDGQTLYINTVANNTTNPNSGGAGWKAFYTQSSITNSNGTAFLVGNFIVQVGSSTFAISTGEAAGGDYNQTLPMPFPNNFLFVGATYKRIGIISGSVGCYADIIDNSTINVTVDPSTVAEPSPATVYWLAIGN